MALPKLIYFAARGRAELIRIVLAETGVPYEEENFKPEDFAALKASGRLPFLAVPVWEADGFRLAQSAAIANYLAREHGLAPKSSREQARVDEVLGAVDDVRLELRKLIPAEPDQRPAIRKELTETILPRWFGQLEKLLASNQSGHAFVVGGSLTLADLALWYLLELSTDNGFGEALAKAPKLRAFAERIGTRQRIAAYRASPKRHPLQKFPG